MNDWKKILEAFDDDKFPDYFYGLTPRFIIGACQNPIGKKFENGQLAYEATKLMFEEMRVFKNAEKIVVSNKCEIHNGPVMSLSECEWTETTIATSFDEIWDRYGKEIVDGKYQINLSDRKIIEQIFQL